MIKKIDAQLEKYDEKVGSSLNVIETNAKGQISLADLKRAMGVIKHKPKEELVGDLMKKLDVDQDGFVVSRIVFDDLSSADPLAGTRPRCRAYTG
jgi:LETM1 and EF-hand domain-containing protein 1